MSRVFETHTKVWWILYLLTSHSVFTLPNPGYSHGPVYIPPTSYARRYNTYNATQSPPEGDLWGVIGAEPIPSASYFYTGIDNLLEEESSPFFRGSRPSRREPPRKSRPKPPRRHPPPIKLSKPPPPQKPVVIKPSKLVKPKPKTKKPEIHHVPKKHHHDHDLKHHSKHHHDHDLKYSKHHNDHDFKHHSKHHDFSSELRLIKPTSNRRPSLKELSRETRSSLETKSLEETKSRREKKYREREREAERDSNRSFMEDDYYPNSAGRSLEIDSASHERTKSSEHSHSKSQSPVPEPSTLHHPGHHAPFPKPPRPVHLSYYYDSNDKKDLKTLITSHHLKRRGKECDGLENFIYDLEVISFLMGVVSAIIGFYSDVIPFFNDGVKISYSNNYGDGDDFPHDYWNKHEGKIDAVESDRTISIGTSEDNVKEVVSVCGEFISLLSLGISFVTLFPSLVEKFFYSLDWWFGKRGLWKQYLYTYKCEIHPYPQVGWKR